MCEILARLQKYDPQVVTVNEEKFIYDRWYQSLHNDWYFNGEMFNRVVDNNYDKIFIMMKFKDYTPETVYEGIINYIETCPTSLYYELYGSVFANKHLPMLKLLSEYCKNPGDPYIIKEMCTSKHNKEFMIVFWSAKYMPKEEIPSLIRYYERYNIDEEIMLEILPLVITKTTNGLNRLRNHAKYVKHDKVVKLLASY